MTQAQSTILSGDQSRVPCTLCPLPWTLTQWNIFSGAYIQTCISRFLFFLIGHWVWNKHFCKGSWGVTIWFYASTNVVRWMWATNKTKNICHLNMVTLSHSLSLSLSLSHTHTHTLPSQLFRSSLSSCWYDKGLNPWFPWYLVKEGDTLSPKHHHKLRGIPEDISNFQGKYSYTQQLLDSTQTTKFTH